MRLYQIAKKWMILTICLSVAACAQSNPDCHKWTYSEKQAMKKADIALPKDSALHPLIRDYEGICIEQNPFRV